MDIGKAFTYVFDDEEWITKVLIGGIVAAIPILNLVAVGYGLRVLRNTAHGEERPLPKWDDWGGDFVRGLMIALAGIIYALPAILLGILGTIVSVITSNSYGDPSGVGVICLVGIQCLGVLWGILVALWLPAATIHYTESEDFGAFFHLAEIWTLISNNLSAYGMAILTTIIASIIGGLGLIVCIIGMIFTSFYGTLVTMHAYGQVAAQANPPTITNSFLPTQEDDPVL